MAFFDLGLSGLLSGGANLLSGLFSSSTAKENMQAQIQAQQGMQQESERYNTEMSNTAYQRARQDMMAAGLNPMMMASGGMSASSPQVTTPSVPMSQNQGMGPSIAKAADSFVSTSVMAKTFDKMTQEIANLQAEEARTKAQELTERKRPGLVAAETGLTQQHTETEKARTEIARSGATVASEEAAEAFGKMKLPQWLFDTAVQGGFLGKKVGDAISPATDILGSATGVGRLLKDIRKDRYHIYGE